MNMKPRKPRFFPQEPSRLAAALALSLGLSAAAFAGPPCTPDEARCDGGPGFHHRHGGLRHPGFGFGPRYPGVGPGFGSGFGFGFGPRLHDELKLDAKQEALWQDALKFSKESFAGGRERFRKHHEEIAALLNQPNADLRVIAKRMDELRSEGQKRHEAVRERWLSVYDALSPGQKEKVRLFLKERSDRFGPGLDRPGRRDACKPGGKNGQPPQTPAENTPPAPR